MDSDDEIPPAMRDSVAARARVVHILSTWQERGPNAGAGATIPADVDVEALLDFYDGDELALFVYRLRGGLQLRYPAAIAAIAALAEASYTVLGVGMRDVDRFDDAGVDEAVADLGMSVGELANALGIPDAAAVIHLRACFAARAVNRLQDAAWAAEHAAAAGARCDPVPRELMAAALQNWGVVLTELARLDEGLTKLRAARDFEDDAGGRTRIDNAIAGALLRIGEYDQAIRWFEANLRALETLDPDEGLDRALALENLANAHHVAGDEQAAAAGYEAAWDLLDDTDVQRAYRNARVRAEAYEGAGDLTSAAIAFEQSRALATRDVNRRLPLDRLRAGFDTAIQRIAPDGSDVWPMIDGAAATSRASGVASAEAPYRAAAAAAGREGDVVTALTCAIRVAQAMMESGVDPVDVEAALSRIRAEAIDSCFPTVAAMADTGIVELLAIGLEASSTGLDRLYLAVEALYLNQASEEFAGDQPESALDRLVPPNPGIALMAVAKAAARAGAYDTAVDHYWDALQRAARSGEDRLEAIRASALLGLLDDREATAELVDPVVERISELLPEIGVNERLSCHLALSRHYAESQPWLALRHAQEAASTVGLDRHDTAWEAAGEAGVRRDAVSETLLARMIACGEPDEETFEVLQGHRAITLMRQLGQSFGTAPFAPPDAGEARRLLAALPTPTAFVDVVETQGGLRAYIVDHAGVRAVDATGDPVALRAPDYGDVRRRAAQLIMMVSTSPLLRELVSAIERTVPPGSALLVSLDDDLSNVPIFAVPYLDGVWADTRSISRIAAVAQLRYLREPPGRRRSVVAGDSARDLPDANAECIDVAGFLGSEPLVGDRCTLAALRSALEAEDLDVVHLAVHGRADAQRGGRTSLLFAGDDGQPEWVGFDDLRALRWRANLIVFSGCSTAVGGPRNGRGLYGVAHAAAAAGATAVVASLWPVDDESTRVFMTRFHRGLAAARAESSVVDLRPIMDRARAALREWLGTRASRGAGSRVRDGRDLTFDLGVRPLEVDNAVADALHWAPFVLVGHPIARFAGA